MADMEATSGEPVFVSYSHKDRKWLLELKTHLEPVKDRFRLEVWDDGVIEIGDDWQEQIDRSLRAARTVVFLVSPGFLASKFIREYEVPIALQRAEGNEAFIRVLYVRASLVDVVPFSYRRQDGRESTACLTRYQGFISPDRPLAGLGVAERDRAMSDFVRAMLSREIEPPPPGPGSSRREEAEVRTRISDARRIARLEFERGSVPAKNVLRRRLSSYFELPPDAVDVAGDEPGVVMADLPEDDARDLVELLALGAFPDLRVNRAVLLPADDLRAGVGTWGNPGATRRPAAAGRPALAPLALAAAIVLAGLGIGMSGWLRSTSALREERVAHAAAVRRAVEAEESRRFAMEELSALRADAARASRHADRLNLEIEYLKLANQDLRARVQMDALPDVRGGPRDVFAFPGEGDAWQPWELFARWEGLFEADEASEWTLITSGVNYYLGTEQATAGIKGILTWHDTELRIGPPDGQGLASRAAPDDAEITFTTQIQIIF